MLGSRNKHDTGPLAMIGGRLEPDNAALFEAMKARCDGRIAVFAMASGYPEEVGGELVEDFTRYGVDAELIPLFHDNRTSAAFDAELIARVQALGSVFFSGGDQSRIVGSLIQDGRPTPMLDAIHALHARGGLIAGTSAGAAIMSGPMIVSGTSMEALTADAPQDDDEDGFRLGRGLGFFRHGLVDQHFLQRGRLGRLLAACRELNEPIAYGIDENSALIVEGDHGTVVGETGVMLLDLRRARRGEHGGDLSGVRVSYLDDGDRIDLARARPLPAGDKRRVRTSRASYRRPAPVRRHAFSSYALHDLLLRLVEGDPVHYRRDRAQAYSPATETEVTIELERAAMRSRALRATRDGELRYSAIAFDLNLKLRHLPASAWRDATTTVLPPDPVPGARLVLLGNSPLKWRSQHVEALLDELREPVGIIATASGEPDTRAEEYRSWLRDLGREAEVLDIRLSNVERASRDRTLLRRIGELGSIVFTGGDQRRLTETLLHCAEATPVLHAIVSAYERGVPVIAVAAAASAFAHRMIVEGDSEAALRHGASEDAGASGVVVEQGIGLTSFGLVDQNFLDRHRLGRLLVASATERHRYGFGLCEESGLVILGGERRMQAIGGRGVVIAALDADAARLTAPSFASDGIRLHLVEPGGEFHLDTLAADAVDPSGAGQALLERAVADLERDCRAVRRGAEALDAGQLRAALLGSRKTEIEDRLH